MSENDLGEWQGEITIRWDRGTMALRPSLPPPTQGVIVSVLSAALGASYAAYVRTNVGNAASFDRFMDEVHDVASVVADDMMVNGILGDL